MGSICCCFHTPDLEDYTDTNGCGCLNCLVQYFTDKYRVLFPGEAAPAFPASNQRAASPNPPVVPNNSSQAHNRAQSRPLLDNASSTLSQRQQDVSSTRSKEGSGHSQVGQDPLQRVNVQVIPKLFGKGGEMAESRHGAGSKVLPEKGESGVGFYGYCSTEDEDVCPTCLEEYTPENPKITTQCSHHYHLSCIYEWVERSSNCPVCGRLMLFDEIK